MARSANRRSDRGAINEHWALFASSISKWQLLPRRQGTPGFASPDRNLHQGQRRLDFYQLAVSLRDTDCQSRSDSPTIIDFLVGLVGGSAAAYARTRHHLSAALAGAAVAAALVPPIATAGLQISLMFEQVAPFGASASGPESDLCSHAAVSG